MKKYSAKDIKTLPEDELSGYPLYPADEDIFNQGQVEPDINPEDPDEVKVLEVYPKGFNVKDFESDMAGEDLDIPGAELDDDQEFIGSEDEENNYYSLGGEDHENLEEDNTD